MSPRYQLTTDLDLMPPATRDDSSTLGSAARAAGDGCRSGDGAVPSAPQRDPAASALQFEGFNPSVVERLVISSEMRPGLVEQYRRLAAGLHLAQLEQSTRIVMVASAVPAEGKTLTAMNLALTLSRSYNRRVLLIDADLRRPSIHDLCRLPNAWGLNDALKAATDRTPPRVALSPGLSVILAGRPNPDPVAALTSDRMRRILSEAAATFDWTVIDTPPVGLLPDAHLLAGMVDTALLVIRAGSTPFGLIQRAVDALGRDRIHGVVLNRVNQAGTASGQTYYGYYDSYFKTR